MQVSAEIRWFWPDDPPPGLYDWFVNGSGDICAAGGGKPGRRDEYLRDEKQVELGIKRRGGSGSGGIEVKGLVAARLGEVEVDPFIGPIELWTKWSSKLLQLEPSSTITVVKQRWLRKLSTVGSSPSEIALTSDEKPKDEQSLPARGCNVELTRVEVSGQDGRWWTLGFEAFGDVTTVGGDLCSVATFLSRRQPPRLEGGFLASYPVWLSAKILSGL